MKLELDEIEVKDILLEWVNRTLPTHFNKVELDVSYGSLRKATFEYEPPEEEEPLADLPAMLQEQAA